MPKHVKTKEFTKAMLATGSKPKTAKRGHTLWLCPCGAHTCTIADNHVTIAATIVTTTRTRMPCLDLRV